jgi:hypothetical protein
VIPAVHKRGTNAARLLGYLFGPGRHEEHEDPRLVATWNGAGDLADLDPPTRGDGRRDVRRLADLLNQPVRAGLKPPALTVWHTSIRLHPTDRKLSDQQWRHIAGEVMNAVGLAPQSDTRAVRWVAVRHAPDHIHLVATLVRQDRRTAWAWKDKLKAQRVCRELEERYSLYRVAPPGQGSRAWPTPAELNKTTHQHQATAGKTATGGKGKRRPVAPREQLRRQVRAAATAATDEADFFDRLARAGVKVKLRHSVRNAGEVTGYAVGLDSHTTAAGVTVWYSGGRLAADLTLPKLRARWRGQPKPEPDPRTAPVLLAALSFPPIGVWQRAERITREAAAALRGTTDPAEAAGIARAAADLLTAAAHQWEGKRGGPLTEAAEVFDRAAYDQRIHALGDHVHVIRLRGMARFLLVNAVMARSDEIDAALRFYYTMAVLIDSLADLREAQQRLHQAHAARDAAGRLRSLSPPVAATPTSPAASGRRWRQPGPFSPQQRTAGRRQP